MIVSRLSKNTKSFPVTLELKWILKLSPPELMAGITGCAALSSLCTAFVGEALFSFPKLQEKLNGVGKTCNLERTGSENYFFPLKL